MGVSGDRIFNIASAVIAATAAVILAITAYTLITGSSLILQTEGLSFFTGIKWNPAVGHEVYGALPYLEELVDFSDRPHHRRPLESGYRDLSRRDVSLDRAGANLLPRRALGGRPERDLWAVGSVRLQVLREGLSRGPPQQVSWMDPDFPWDPIRPGCPDGGVDTGHNDHPYRVLDLERGPRELSPTR